MRGGSASARPAATSCRSTPRPHPPFALCPRAQDMEKQRSEAIFDFIQAVMHCNINRRGEGGRYGFPVNEAFSPQRAVVAGGSPAALTTADLRILNPHWSSERVRGSRIDAEADRIFDGLEACVVACAVNIPQR